MGDINMNELNEVASIVDNATDDVIFIEVASDPNICDDCEHNVICDWWIVCTGDCKVCEEYDATIEDMSSKITTWCGHECAMRKWKDENDNRISN